MWYREVVGKAKTAHIRYDSDAKKLLMHRIRKGSALALIFLVLVIWLLSRKIDNENIDTEKMLEDIVIKPDNDENANLNQKSVGYIPPRTSGWKKNPPDYTLNMPSVVNKRARSIAGLLFLLCIYTGTFTTINADLDSKASFLACIAEDRTPETNPKWGTQFREQLFDCVKLHIPIEKYEMDAFKAINVEYKYFLPMDKSYLPDSAKGCIWLTIGIGNSTSAEKEFLKMYKKNGCKLFGIEIAPENEGDFAAFGTVIHAGIHSGCGLLTLIAEKQPDF